MTRPETGGTKNRNQLSYLTSKRMVVLANAACDHKGSLGKKNTTHHRIHVLYGMLIPTDVPYISTHKINRYLREKGKKER